VTTSSADPQPAQPEYLNSQATRSGVATSWSTLALDGRLFTDPDATSATR
jgi:hypothetical protein